MLSAHADKDELMRWASGFAVAPRTAFIIHGEPAGSDALRHALEEACGWKCLVPDHNQSAVL
jgi:metallo-beta-lactamase family protein